MALEVKVTKFGQLMIDTVSTLLAVVMVAIILALPVMWLWNWLLPDLFSFKQIGFLQACGLNLLTALLFAAPTKLL